MEKVLGLVKRMLDTERLRRIIAVDLAQVIGNIYNQTKLDIQRPSNDSLVQDLGLDTQRSSQPLPRLSTDLPDRRAPELVSSVAAYSDTPPIRHNLYTDPNYLTASPLSTSSIGGRRRNSANSEITFSSRPRTHSDSSMRVYGGSPRSPEGSLPDATSEGNRQA